jgi:hypothetical protein
MAGVKAREEGPFFGMMKNKNMRSFNTKQA